MCHEGEGSAPPHHRPPEFARRAEERKKGSRVREGGGSSVYIVKGEGCVWFAELKGFSDDL